MYVEHLGDFPNNVEVVPYSCTWEQIPTSNVITGGTMNISMGSMKRKFEELMSDNLWIPLQFQHRRRTTVGVLRF
jgi:hypothetical protein